MTHVRNMALAGWQLVLDEALAGHLRRLYDPAGVDCALRGIQALLAEHPVAAAAPALDERDTWLVAYADHVRDGDRPPLEVLGEVLRDDLADLVGGLHLLPFHPSTSDDGFAVRDHLQVDPALGTWDDVRSVGRSTRLMVDAVVNHVSASSAWVRRWQAGERPAFVLERPEGFDDGAVVRPRTTPLFTPFEGPDGKPSWAWTTFSPDQVDLDFTNPEVLVAVTGMLLGYVAAGARAIRLDAVGFLWKESGTGCLSLPQTHEIVRLWRTIVDAVAPGTLLVTETHVPHGENVGYFAGGRGAHLVYQFPLAPLVLAAFCWGNAQALTSWAASLEPPPAGAAFLNFLGCHDGIGLRGVEGLLPGAQLQGLCDLARAAGGGVSYGAAADGGQVPYELNTTYVDALDAVADDGYGVARVAAAHAILLALQGVPALWMGSLLGQRNDYDGASRSGRLRSLNRGRLDVADVRALLGGAPGFGGAVHRSIAELVRLRRASPAFAPDSQQRILPAPGWLFAVERQGRGRRALVLVSVSSRDHRVVPSALAGPARWRDRLAPPAHALVNPGDSLVLAPYGIAWLESVD